MSEAEEEFWIELRFSITNTEIFKAYCDWIEPQYYHFTQPEANIKGKIGFLTHEMEVYNFILTIPNQVMNSSEINWNEL